MTTLILSKLEEALCQALREQNAEIEEGESNTQAVIYTDDFSPDQAFGIAQIDVTRLARDLERLL